MHIVFIAGTYPTPSRPEKAPFLQQFVWAMARQGHRCTVLNPTSLFDRRHGPLPERYSSEDAGNGKRVTVQRPRFLSCSSRKLGWLHTGRWTNATFTRCVTRNVKAVGSPDVIYGHFMYPSGYAAVFSGKMLDVPSVIGVGEGTFWTIDPFGFAHAKRHIAQAAGFLALGSHIRDGLTANIGIPPDRVVVEPNGVDRKRFFKSDRRQARSQLGLEPNLFLVAFVGAFDDLKGGSELVRAVDGLNGVELVMLGQGEKTFRSENIRYQGWVHHGQLATWLNAADLFVLPTREEGSCNAVIEAMACGLPIVTSDGRYMDDLVDDEVAIRLNPTDVGAIRSAILALKKDPERRQRMSKACLRKVRTFDIDERARRVTFWLEDIVRRHGI